MKKIMILMILALSLMFMACSNGSSSTDDKDNKKPIWNSGSAIYVCVAFKINGVQCYNYLESQSYVANNIIWIKDYTNLNNFDPSQGIDSIANGNIISKLNLDENFYGKVYLPASRFEDLLSDEVRNNTWPGNCNPYSIEDVRVYVFTDNEYKTGIDMTKPEGERNEWILESTGYDNGYFYIKNTGSNNFSEKQDIFNLMPYKKGDKNNYEIVYPAFHGYSFAPETYWMNDLNYDSVESYIYKFKVVLKLGIYKDESKDREEVEIQINLKDIFRYTFDSDKNTFGNFYDNFKIE